MLRPKIDIFVFCLKVASFLADLETSGILKDESSDHENKMEPEGTEEAKPPQGTSIFQGSGDLHKMTFVCLLCMRTPAQHEKGGFEVCLQLLTVCLQRF